MISQDDQLIFRYFEWKKNYKKDFNKDLINRFANTYEFLNKGINKFILLLRKGIYLYEYKDSWERFDETSLPDKETFYSSLNMEGTKSVDYRYAKRVYREFKMNNLGEYYDLYVQSDKLLLADVFENIRNKCIEIYELDPDNFLSAPGQKELLTDIDMLLMVEKGTRGGIYHAIHRYAKANNKYIQKKKEKKDKNKESSYLMYLDANNLYGWEMSQKLLLDSFKWKKKRSINLMKTS